MRADEGGARSKEFGWLVAVVVPLSWAMPIWDARGKLKISRASRLLVLRQHFYCPSTNSMPNGFPDTFMVPLS
jgi:hypothetical protein